MKYMRAPKPLRRRGVHSRDQKQTNAYLDVGWWMNLSHCQMKRVVVKVSPLLRHCQTGCVRWVGYVGPNPVGSEVPKLMEDPVRPSYYGWYRGKRQSD
jgi:hypothetical protein